MQNQLLLSIAAIGIAAAGMGAGTFAFFSDEGSSTENVLTAATIDLHLDAGEDTSETLTFANMVPGDTTSGSIDVSNSGSYDAADFDLDFAVDFVETEGSPHYVSGDESMAEALEVTAASYGADDLLAAGGCEITDSATDGNDFVDIADWDTQACVDAAEPGASTILSISLEFDEDAGNGAQGDSVDVTIRFLLGQSNDGADDITA